MAARLDSPIKAGLIPDMALALIDGDLEDQAILIAIDEDLADILGVAALFTLGPELAAGSAEIGGPAGGERAVQGLAVHPCHHEDLARFGILGDGRDQPLGVKLRRELQSFFDPF